MQSSLDSFGSFAGAMFWMLAAEAYVDYGSFPRHDAVPPVVDPLLASVRTMTIL
jgi:hypothetical protein